MLNNTIDNYRRIGSHWFLNHAREEVETMVTKINNSPFFGMLTGKYGEEVSGPVRI